MRGEGEKGRDRFHRRRSQGSPGRTIFCQQWHSGSLKTAAYSCFLRLRLRLGFLCVSKENVGAVVTITAQSQIAVSKPH